MDAIPISGVNAVVDKGRSEGLGKLCKRTKVFIVASPLAGAENGEKCVMEIVAPLCVNAKAAGFPRSHQPRIV